MLPALSKLLPVACMRWRPGLEAGDAGPALPALHGTIFTQGTMTTSLSSQLRVNHMPHISLELIEITQYLISSTEDLGSTAVSSKK